MGPEDRKSGFPHARGSRHPLLLTHDVFFGELQSSRSANGITLSHRIAASPPDEVEIHTHLDPHFVLVTSGHYVSSARDAPNRGTTLVYNPPGTTHARPPRRAVGSHLLCPDAGRMVASLDRKRLGQTLWARRDFGPRR